METEQISLGRFVDPSRDAGFKTLFCDADNLDVLKILVNSFLPADRQAVELEYAGDREVQGLTVAEKVIHVDLRCRDERGRTFIVEMQRQPQNFFVKRCLEYSTRLYSSQLKKSDGYGRLMPVYVIALLRCPLREDIPGRDKAIARYSFCELEEKAFAFDDISLIFVRLDRAKRTAAECRDAGERCLHYLAHMYDMEDYPEDEAFGTFFRKAEIAALSPEKRDQYIADMITERDYENILDTAREIGFEKGEAKGYEDGHYDGLEEGMAKGKLEAARSFKAAGASPEMIATATGLTAEQIAAL